MQLHSPSRPFPIPTGRYSLAPLRWWILLTVFLSYHHKGHHVAPRFLNVPHFAGPPTMCIWMLCHHVFAVGHRRGRVQHDTPCLGTPTLSLAAL